MRNISLAFTTYNSFKYIERQFNKDYFTMSNNLVDEIVIQDDCTSDYDKLKNYESENIKVFQNKKRLSPLLSRPNLVSNCKNDWILLMDSDNFLESNIFDIIPKLSLENSFIYCPSFAKPNFDFRKYSDIKIDINFAKKHFEDLSLQIFLNTGNYLIHKDTYLNVSNFIEKKYAYYTVDVIYFNFLFLSLGNFLYCTPKFEYEHTIRFDSYYQTTHNISQEKLKEVNQMYLNYGNI